MRRSALADHTLTFRQKTVFDEGSHNPVLWSHRFAGVFLPLLLIASSGFGQQSPFPGAPGSAFANSVANGTTEFRSSSNALVGRISWSVQYVPVPCLPQNTMCGLPLLVASGAISNLSACELDIQGMLIEFWDNSAGFASGNTGGSATIIYSIPANQSLTFDASVGVAYQASQIIWITNVGPSSGVNGVYLQQEPVPNQNHLSNIYRTESACFDAIPGPGSGGPGLPGPASALFPHIVDGDDWSTSVLLTNTGSKTASYQLNFWQDSGAPLTLHLQSGQTSAFVSGNIPPDGLQVLETLDLTGSTTVAGWASLASSSSGVSGLTIFRQRGAGNRPDFEAAVPLISPFQDHFTLPFDNSGGYSTGVALVNPSNSQTLTINVLLHDQSGTAILGGQPIVLPPFGHVSFNMATDPAYTNTRGIAGTAIFYSAQAFLGGLGLRFNPGGAFTFLPGIADGSERTSGLLPQMADAGRWQSILELRSSVESEARTARWQSRRFH